MLRSLTPVARLASKIVTHFIRGTHNTPGAPGASTARRGFSGGGKAGQPRPAFDPSACSGRPERCRGTTGSGRAEFVEGLVQGVEGRGRPRAPGATASLDLVSR